MIPKCNFKGCFNFIQYAVHHITIYNDTEGHNNQEGNF